MWAPLSFALKGLKGVGNFLARPGVAEVGMVTYGLGSSLYANSQAAKNVQQSLANDVPASTPMAPAAQPAPAPPATIPSGSSGISVADFMNFMQSTNAATQAWQNRIGQDRLNFENDSINQMNALAAQAENERLGELEKKKVKNTSGGFYGRNTLFGGLS